MTETKAKGSSIVLPWWSAPVVAAIFYLLGASQGGGLVGAHSGHEHDPVSQLGVKSHWSCSMHPQVQQSGPGKCPLCGMDLIRVSGSETSGSETHHRITLSPAAKLRARIATVAVRRLDNSRVERQLLGRVDYDETTLRTVSVWTGGRIESLLVSATGQKVRRGQIIAKLYSPEIYSAHQDLIQANRQLQRLSAASPAAVVASTAALQASRNRLRLLGVPTAEVTAMERSAVPTESVAIRSPFSGTVIERLATEGNYVTTGTGLYTVADLSHLWVQLDAYESDLPLLSVGQQVSLSVEALPGRPFGGRVTFVDPVLNRRTRTARVRIEVNNQGGRLRPGMFAEATVHAGAIERGAVEPLVIPASSALFTGRRSVVYVEVPNAERPQYEARVVRLGSKRGEVYPVVAGLVAGERVVVRGAFALDAELQIRGGTSMMSVPDDQDTEQEAPGVAIPSEYRKELGAVVDKYLALHRALAVDALSEARKSAREIEHTTSAILPAAGSPFYNAWMPIARHIKALAAKLVQGASLGEQRVAFRDLSHQIATVLRVLGNPLNESLRLASCPMALGGKGAEWIQQAEKIENPYFGPAMHSCGEVHSTVAHGTYLPLSDKKAAIGELAH